MLKFYTKDPAGLLKKFEEKIKAKVGQDSIQTWEQIGGNFSHTAERWKGKMSFKTEIDTAANGSSLIFLATAQNGPTKEDRQTAYAYYHGHLLQTFVDHFGDFFTVAKYVDNRKK